MRAFYQNSSAVILAKSKIRRFFLQNAGGPDLHRSDTIAGYCPASIFKLFRPVINVRPEAISIVNAT